MRTVLVVEDEQEIQKHIQYNLTNDGFNVLVASTGEAALELFNRYSFDIILLDIMLPGIDGTEVLKKIREVSSVPIIIISALNDELIQVDAFESKVDDYVIKPFSMSILIHKIKAILRRVGVDDNNVININGICIEVDNYSIKYNDTPLSLTSKEFELLQLLMINENKVFSRDEF